MKHGNNKTRDITTWLLNPVNFLFILLGFVPLFLLAIFIFIHKENIMWADEYRALDMVLAIRNGTFNIGYLFRLYWPHYSVFTFLLIALLVFATDYNIVVGLVINVILAASSCALIISLFRRNQSEITVYMLPAFSMLIFSPHQDINWLGVYVGMPFFVLLFFLLGLRILTSHSDSWPALVAAAACSLCATFSQGAGLLSWPLFGAILYFRGYRKWSHHLFWIASAAISLAIVLLDPNSSLFTNRSWSLLDIVRFVPMYLGAVFVSRFILGSYMSLYDASLLVGLGGVILLLVDVAYLWWKEKDRGVCTTWLPLAGFGVGAGVLIAFKCLSPGEPFSNRPFISWYSTIANTFWVALVALGAIVVWRISRADMGSWWRRLLMFGNIGVGVVLFTLFLIQNQRVEATSYVSSNNLNGDTWIAGTPITDECAVDYVFTLDGACTAEYIEGVNRMAAYRLNVFAYTSPISILPDGYPNGEPILVETDSEWSAIHIRDWSLAGADENDVIFVFPGDPTEAIDIPNPLDNAIRGYAAADTEQLNDLLDEAETFWYIRQPDRYPGSLGAFFEDIEESGYVVISETRSDRGGYVISEYRLSSQ